MEKIFLENKRADLNWRAGWNFFSLGNKRADLNKRAGWKIRSAQLECADQNLLFHKGILNDF